MLTLSILQCDTYRNCSVSLTVVFIKKDVFCYNLHQTCFTNIPVLLLPLLLFLLLFLLLPLLLLLLLLFLLLLLLPSKEPL